MRLNRGRQSEARAQVENAQVKYICIKGIKIQHLEKNYSLARAIIQRQAGLDSEKVIKRSSNVLKRNIVKSLVV
jgi:hypothetical protein